MKCFERQIVNAKLLSDNLILIKVEMYRPLTVYYVLIILFTQTYRSHNIFKHIVYAITTNFSIWLEMYTTYRLPLQSVNKYTNVKCECHGRDWP